MVQIKVRKKRAITKGSSLLLDALWKANGGVSELGRLLGIQRQHLANWKLAGKVPLKWIGMVSKLIKVSPFALNYTEYSRFKTQSKPWEEVVKSCKLPPAIEKKILSLEAPSND